jgi:F-type H+-transporting ATPase subunit delta
MILRLLGLESVLFAALWSSTYSARYLNFGSGNFDGKLIVSQTDMITTEVAHRYAAALFDLAKDAKSLKAVEKDLKTLKGLFLKSESLNDMVNSPVLAISDKTSALLALAKKAKLSKLTHQFLGTVTQNHRAGEIPGIITAFEQKLDAMRGNEKAEVISAKKLSAAQLAAIKKQLKKTLGNDVSIQARVDPSLLGGFAVKIGSRYFDSTLKTKLEGLKMAMKEA